MNRRNFIINILFGILAFFFGYKIKKENGKNLATPMGDISKINIDLFPRLDGEIHDIPRINRALAFLKTSDREAELHFNDETYTVIPEKPASNDTHANSDKKRIRLRSNISLIGISGKTIFRVIDNNPNYHTLIEEENPNVESVKNVRIRYIIFDHNVYNNQDKPDGSINNHKETFRIYKSENVSIRHCKIISNSINPINFRMGLVQSDLNNGVYPNKDLEFKRNELVFIGLDLPYYDNTFVTFCGDGVDVSFNKIRSERVSSTQACGENTAIELSGKNIICEENIITNYLLGIDVTTLDTYPTKRNIKILSNKMYDAARGVKLWGGSYASYVLSGIEIKENDIVLNQRLFKDRAELSTRCGIGLSNNTSNSLGTMKDIDIVNNKISMENEARDYLLTLDYEGRYYSGLSFDAHYNGIFLGGTGQIPSNINIKRNEFFNLPCPAIYTGHSNLINDVDILNNIFVDCGYGKRSAIMAFSNRNENFTISGNTYLDKGQSSMNGKKLYTFIDGNYQASKFVEFVFTNNAEFVKVNTENYTSEFNSYLPSLVFDKLIMDGPPGVRPLRVGLMYIDKTNKSVYISVGITFPTDWKKIK